MLGRKQRNQVTRSFPNRYLFSFTNKVTSLFSIRYILIIILECKSSRLLINFSTRLLAILHLQDYYKRLGEPLQSTWRGITKHLEKSCRYLSLFENRLFSFALPCFLLTKQWLVTLDFIIRFVLHLIIFNRSRL